MENGEKKAASLMSRVSLEPSAPSPVHLPRILEQRISAPVINQCIAPGKLNSTLVFLSLSRSSVALCKPSKRARASEETFHVAICAFHSRLAVSRRNSQSSFSVSVVSR